MEYLEIAWRPEPGRDDPDAAEARAQLARIRELMEGTATYRVLSGGSAVVAGTIALAACALSIAAQGGGAGGLGAAAAMVPTGEGALRALVAIWAVAFVAAASVELWLTKRAARRSRSRTFYFPSGSPMLRRMRLAYLAPLLGGAALTAALVRAGAYSALPAAWLVSYGTAVVCAGLFSTPPVRALGTAILLSGAAAAALPGLNLVWLAVGFGAAHLVYGATQLAPGRDAR